MHPIFGNRTTFAAYVTVWAGLAFGLADLLRVPSAMSWRDAFLLSGAAVPVAGVHVPVASVYVPVASSWFPRTHGGSA